MKTTWKKRCTAGFLAVLLGCSSLLAGGSSAFAAPLEQTDVKEETQAEDITIEQGETFLLFCQQIKKESCLMQTDLEGMTVFTRSKNLPEILMRLHGKSL